LIGVVIPAHNEAERLPAVLERLRAKVPKRYIATRVLKITGMGESACDARVAPIYKRYTDVNTTILAGPGEIQVHLRTQAQSLDAAQLRVDDLVDKIEAELGDSVYSDNGDSLEQIVSYFLQMRNSTLSVAESCTGGLVAERLTSVSGSSRYFIGGAVVYSNELKTQLADVPRDLIEDFGAVSEQVAKALAEGIRKRADIPTVAAGIINQPAQAEGILRAGSADLIALGRGMTYNPRWAWHAAAELGEESVYFPPQYARSHPSMRLGDFYKVYQDP